MKRSLSERQAQACENAEDERCECRCGGALHGARRTRNVRRLARSDPHFPTEAERVLYVRLGEADHQAVKAAAARAELSVGAFVAAVLRAAPALQAHAAAGEKRGSASASSRRSSSTPAPAARDATLAKSSSPTSPAPAIQWRKNGRYLVGAGRSGFVYTIDWSGWLKYRPRRGGRTSVGAGGCSNTNVTAARDRAEREERSRIQREARKAHR